MACILVVNPSTFQTPPFCAKNQTSNKNIILLFNIYFIKPLLLLSVKYIHIIDNGSIIAFCRVKILCLTLKSVY